MRVTGFVLLAIGIVGAIAAFSSLDERGAQLMSIGAYAMALSEGTAFGGAAPLSSVTPLLAVLALVGVGLLIFGKRSK